MAKPRVLLIAEQANPEFVSVPLEGWSHSQAIAEVADTHLVTQVRNREAILKAGLTEGEDFTAIDSEKVAARMHKLSGVLRGGKGKGWTTVMALNAVSYAYFEKLVWKQFGDAIRRGEYDVVHRLTPLSPTLPSSLAKKCKKAGVPFVWGPINGGVAWPKAFNAARRAEREWLSYVRDAYRLLPGYRATREHAHTVIVGSTATYDQVPSRYHDKCVYIPENAIDPAKFVAKRSRSVAPGEPIKLAFVGRLVPYKGADMLLDAVAELVRNQRVTVTIIGDGPERGKLEGIIEREGLAEGVTLAGWVDHAQLQHTLAEHDVFAFPSIREFGGAVVLEAMAVGLVPVVVDYGGPGELVTDTTGHRVAIGPREQIVADFKAAIGQLADNPDKLEPMSHAAMARVEQLFTWPAKAKQVAAVYAHAAGETAERPDFGMPLPDVDAGPSSSSKVDHASAELAMSPGGDA
ncbi:MAG: glycosyltransferase family 4 protein [Planctomycetota bacterium]